MVNIRGTGRHALEYLNHDDTRSRFEPAGSIWLNLQDLQVVRQLEPASGATRSTLSTYVCGTACLDDGDLSVIGEPRVGARTIRLTFSSREISIEDHQGLRDLQDALGTTFSDTPLGIARLGFNRADQEMSEPAQWWASLDVPASSLVGLTEGVDDGRLCAVKLCLCLKGVYTHASDVADEHQNPSLFLRPGSTDASDSPEVATGYVTHLTLDLARICLGESDSKSASPDRRAAGDHRVIPETEAVRAINKKLDKLSVLVTWLAVLVTALVIGFGLWNR
jgi:phosphate:Na+ symporter